MVLLDTGTPGTKREIYSEDADGETVNFSTGTKSEQYACLDKHRKTETMHPSQRLGSYL